MGRPSNHARSTPSAQRIELPPSFHKVEALARQWMKQRYEDGNRCSCHDLDLLGIRLELLAEIVKVVQVYVNTNGNANEACRVTDQIADLDDLTRTLDAWKTGPTYPLDEFRWWCLNVLLR